MSLELTLINHSNHPMPRQFIARCLKFIHRQVERSLGLSLKGRSLSVVFLDARSAKKLNHSLRQKNYPTDILSFGRLIDEKRDDQFCNSELAELVICPQIVALQAKQNRMRQWEELSYVLVHGVLHLLGYDHELNAQDAEEMFTLQDEWFEKFCRQYEKSKKR